MLLSKVRDNFIGIKIYDIYNPYSEIDIDRLPHIYLFRLESVDYLISKSGHIIDTFYNSIPDLTKRTIPGFTMSEIKNQYPFGYIIKIIPQHRMKFTHAIVHFIGKK